MYKLLRRTAKNTLMKCGLRTTQSLWVGMALRQYQAKIASDVAYKKWLETHSDRWIARHWGHYEIADKFEMAHTSSQLYEIIGMLKRRIGDLNGHAVLDAGASDGMFMTLLGVQKGVGINILPACVDRIRRDGFDARQCNVEELPFPDKSFDYILCCETLEHVLNPIRTLNELTRVCKGRILLTIPWLPRTRLNAKPAGWPETESHIFEFSPEDFQKIVTFSNAEIVYKDFIHVFPEPKNPLLRWWISQMMYSYYFPKLQYYELVPAKGKTR